MRKATVAEIAEAKADLLEMIKPGDTIYTILRHVSKSGMFRRISLVLIDKQGGIRHIDYAANVVLNHKKFTSDDNEGIPTSGCGMDMGYHLVYGLSSILFRDNFTCIGRGDWGSCPSNDHSNGERNYEPHLHSDGGYALGHRWL